MSSEVAYHDVYCGAEEEPGTLSGMSRQFTIPDWLQREALKISGKVMKGLIVMGDWFIDSEVKMNDIQTYFPDVRAVDMESVPIVHTCHRHGGLCVAAHH